MTGITKLYQRYFGRVTVSTTYVPQIDGLRFFAIMPVLIYHATLRGERIYRATHHGGGRSAQVDEWLPAGEIGVALFFFISGYIIAYPFLRHGRSTEVDLLRFYLRRLLRLWPEYALVLMLCFLGLAVSGYHPADAPRFNAVQQPPLYSLLAGLAYVHGLIFDAANRLNPPMWSLEIEVQFYLVVPLILWVMRVTQPCLSLLTSIALCIGLTVATEVAGGIFPDTIQRWTIVKYLYLFVLGICFSDYALRSVPLRLEAQRRYDAGFVVGLLLFCAAGSLHSWMGFHQSYPLSLRICRNISLIASVSLIYLGALRGVAGRRICALPWISATGGMCYSIYLIHDPVMQGMAEVLKRLFPHASVWTSIIVCNIVLIPTALVVGGILFVAVERPLMKPSFLDSVYHLLTRSRAGASKVRVRHRTP